MRDSYTSEDIKFLPADHQSNRFLFVKKEELTKKYPSRSPDFIDRLLDSCSMIGFSIELAERRYLAGDTSVIIPSELFEVFKEVSKR